jgi:hypothetical protein
MLVDGEPKVFAFTTKRVDVGEIFYINYGDEFKTEGFKYIQYDEPT